MTFLWATPSCISSSVKFSPPPCLSHDATRTTPDTLSAQEIRWNREWNNKQVLLLYLRRVRVVTHLSVYCRMLHWPQACSCGWHRSPHSWERALNIWWSNSLWYRLMLQCFETFVKFCHLEPQDNVSWYSCLKGTNQSIQNTGYLPVRGNIKIICVKSKAQPPRPVISQIRTSTSVSPSTTCRIPL